MCLIIHAPAGSVIPDVLIESARRRNSDGWGVTYHDGKLRVKKGLDMSKLLPVVKKASKYDRLVHLRLATHGDKNMYNCHPFKINDDLWFMHNGIMTEFGNLDNKKSDSRYFADNIIAPLAEYDPAIIEAYHFRTIMAEFSGSFNKFAFMDARGKVLRTGKWEVDSKNGIYLSNTYAYDNNTVHLDSHKSYSPSKYTRTPYTKPTPTKEGAKSGIIHDIDDDEHWNVSAYDDWLSKNRNATSREYLRDAEFNTQEDIEPDEDTTNPYERKETLALSPAIDLPIVASCDITSLRDIQHLETEEIRLLCESEPYLMAQFIKNG